MTPTDAEKRCKTCGGPIPLPIRASYAKRRGFCSARCNVAYRPQLRTVLCANVTCKKGDGGTRKVFATYQAAARCCSASCNATQYERERAAAKAEAATARAVPDVDLPADVIERRLEALARRRRETRSWLRIEDPWQQREGSELHKSVLVDTYDIHAGAIL